MNMRKNRIINLLLVLVILTVSILPMILFRSDIQITKPFIPAICILAFHLIYGIAAYCFRHKGNFLRLNLLFLRHFIFNFVEPNKDYTFTDEYKRTFYRMLAVYYVVVPLYIPCIFLTPAVAALPLALGVFLIPQILFISTEIGALSNDIKEQKEVKQQQDQERKEQEKREELGKWK